MTRDEFDAFCQGLKSTTNVVQWGGASVWKVGGKLFAICSDWGEGEHQKISFRCSDHSAQILCELPGIRLSKSLIFKKWVRITEEDALNNDDLQYYITTAHDIITQKLTRAKRADLGL